MCEHDNSKTLQDRRMKFEIWLLYQNRRPVSNFGPNPPIERLSVHVFEKKILSSPDLTNPDLTAPNYIQLDLTNITRSPNESKRKNPYITNF